jgi:hypothetical protein
MPKLLVSKWIVWYFSVLPNELSWKGALSTSWTKTAARQDRGRPEHLIHTIFWRKSRSCYDLYRLISHGRRDIWYSPSRSIFSGEKSRLFVSESPPWGNRTSQMFVVFVFGILSQYKWRQICRRVGHRFWRSDLNHCHSNHLRKYCSYAWLMLRGLLRWASTNP